MFCVVCAGFLDRGRLLKVFFSRTCCPPSSFPARFVFSEPPSKNFRTNRTRQILTRFFLCKIKHLQRKLLCVD